MIFVSHNYNDKAIVERFALALSDVFGQEKVFYDSWSIQPGDGIIDRMNVGLSSCKFFLFFVTKNSLKSKMVQLEWQNALMAKTMNGIKFIPIKVDNSEMPILLMQSLYIDLYSTGIDASIRQAVDVISGKSTYSPIELFSNLHSNATQSNGLYILNIEAKSFMEPVSSFLLVFNNNITEFKFDMPDECAYNSSESYSIKIDEQTSGQAKALGLDRAIVPGHPLSITIEIPIDVVIDLRSILHERTKGIWVPIPLTWN